MGFYVQVLFLLGTASLLHAGRCPEIPIRKLDASRFEGTWYQTEWLNTGITSRAFQRSTRCVEFDFTLSSMTDFLALTKWKYQAGRFFYPASSSSTYLRMSPELPNYYLTNGIPWLPLPTTNIFILDTDYTRYAIIYSCVYVGPFVPPIEMSWILHRKRTGLANRRRKTILASFPTDIGINFINTSRYNRIDNSGCSDDGGPSVNVTTVRPD